MAASPDAAHVLVSSMHPLGLRVSDALPAGWLDFGVRGAAAAGSAVGRPGLSSGAPASVDATGPTDHDELAVRGVAAAAEVGLGPGGRLLTDCNPATPEGIATTLVGPLMVGASVVLLTTEDAERRTAIGSQERTTCTRWQARPR